MVKLRAKVDTQKNGCFGRLLSGTCLWIGNPYCGLSQGAPGSCFGKVACPGPINLFSSWCLYSYHLVSMFYTGLTKKHIIRKHQNQSPKRCWPSINSMLHTSVGNLQAYNHTPWISDRRIWDFGVQVIGDLVYGLRPVHFTFWNLFGGLFHDQPAYIYTPL